MCKVISLTEEKICQIYREKGKTLDKTLSHIVQLLDGATQTIATAESCTGGMLAERITSVSGASNVFPVGLVTYASEMKTKLLGVPAELIAEKGVVSNEVARAMVQGLHRVSGCDYCLSVTGIAGPGGGTKEQPVGTVYVAISKGEDILLSGDLALYKLGLTQRQEIRQAVSICLFGYLEEILEEN